MKAHSFIVGKSRPKPYSASLCILTYTTIRSVLRKLIAVVLALTVAMTMGIASTSMVFAAGGTPSITIKPNIDEGITTNGDNDVKIKYTYYKILTADIDTDPTVGLDGTTTADGTVAYYVTDSAQAAAIEGLKTGGKSIFNVTRVGTTDKWYVELNKETAATGEQIAAAFNDNTFLAKFTKQEFTSTGGDATLPGVSAGYYFIKSSLGSKMAVQTLSPVTINEKNDYVSDNKTIPNDDKNSQIGQEITYTLTVNVPTTATEEIVLTDTMSKGLTFKEVASQKVGTTAMTEAQKGTVSAVSSAANDATKFTITYTADQVKALVANKEETQVINIEVTVIVNDQAAIDTDIPNTLDLKYGNNYEAKPVTVNTKTTKFEFDKVDGTDKTTKLTGAEFQLKKGSDVIKLIKDTEGQTYRVATAAEITAAGTTLVDTIVTNGNTVTINGLDLDETYSLVETKAPTGYNKLDDPIEVKATSTTTGEGNDAVTTTTFVKKDVENNKGTELPSTGGIGTTIFYILGALLVVGCGIILIARRRSSANN
ncbi:MAG: SpaH/EbpB family LPXTG-anchored major pilin [Firmicutes bacterium]|nr:SpaH/EbpB family LPXTG-anchored major pilin [Bacillota bacterium]